MSSQSFFFLYNKIFLFNFSARNTLNCIFVSVFDFDILPVFFRYFRPPVRGAPYEDLMKSFVTGR